jgi:transketolase
VTTPRQADLDLLCLNTLGTLAIDPVKKANAGHPCTPMGAAHNAHCL